MSAAIVYIDDEPKICRVFELNLKIREFEVATFTNPSEAIDYINGHDEVVVVFSDYRMPEMTGAQVFKHLKRDVSFFLVTGGTGAYEDSTIDERIRAILPKPIDYDEIVRLAREAMT